MNNNITSTTVLENNELQNNKGERGVDGGDDDGCFANEPCPNLKLGSCVVCWRSRFLVGVGVGVVVNRVKSCRGLSALWMNNNLRKFGPHPVKIVSINCINYHLPIQAD